MSDIPEHEKKICYALFVAKIVTYSIFTVLNGVQVYHEAKFQLIKRNMFNTKFFVFLFMALFCLTRVIYALLFLLYPDDWTVGTLFYFFFAWGIFFVFIGWSFLGSFWLQLLYQFFTSKEIRTKSIRKIYILSFSLVSIYFCWHVPIEIIFLYDDSIAILEAIGMLVFLAIFFTSIIVNGMILVKKMKESVKTSKYQDNYKSMIFKSKVLIYTVVICIIIVLAQDIVINFFMPRDPQPYNTMIISNFLTGIADTAQMIVVMWVLGNNSLKCYFLFKSIPKVKGSSESEITAGSQLTDKNNSLKNSNISLTNSKIESFEKNSKNSKSIDIEV